MIIKTKNGQNMSMAISGCISGKRVESATLIFEDLKKLCAEDHSVQIEFLRKLRDAMVIK